MRMATGKNVRPYCPCSVSKLWLTYSVGYVIFFDENVSAAQCRSVENLVGLAKQRQINKTDHEIQLDAEKVIRIYRHIQATLSQSAKSRLSS